jgi:predicted ATP-grasp superfamily ATP-dependent carboligase
MKTPLILAASLFVFLNTTRAQYSVAVVSDPIAQVNHSQNLAKWVESIQKLNTQIDQMNQSIQIAQTVKGYIGDPASAAGAMGLGLLGGDSLGASVGQLSSELNRTASGLSALRNNAQGLFTPIEFKTPGGFDMEYADDPFKAFAALQNHAQNSSNVLEDTLARIRRLQQDKAATLAQIKTAPTQAEVQKLQAKADAIDGEIAALGQQQAAAQEQVVVQDAANRNDRAMKAQAANMAADREMAVSLDNLSRWQGEITRSREPFK